ncbi:MAG: CocE/NonD family hydrolase [Eubacterium sp.]|nr:CocE/NonD family hydrolase [Eubacterium sp.]
MGKQYEASEPIYEVIREENVMVEVRDGIHIAVDVYRPKAEGKFPALLAMSPYGKISQVYPITPPMPFGSSIFEASCESGDPFYFASRGYVFVIADHRGTGDSEGTMYGFMDYHEGEDGHDVVEWMAKQEWCTGKVGLCGICYFANTQMQIAVTQPPSLVCMAPWEIYGDDPYVHANFDGGVQSLFFYGLYTGTYPARVGYGIKNIKSWMIENTDPDELKKMVDEMCEDPKWAQYPYIYHLLKYPEKNPLLFDMTLNPDDNQYWRDRSFIEKIDKINVPIYVGGPNFSFFGLSQINTWNRLPDNIPKKLRLYKDMGMRPWKDDHDELLRWYDYWLKGMDTGIMDEPDVRYQTGGKIMWHEASAYPPEDTQWTELYLASLGKLEEEPELFNDWPDTFTTEPLTVSNDRAMLTYVTDPLSEDCMITGGAQAVIYGEINNDETTWRIDLREVGNDGAPPLPLGQGWLRAQHRAIDEEKSSVYEVRHDHSKAVPVPEGEIVRYDIQLRPCSHIFKAGTRIRVDISANEIPTDPETYDVMWHVCPDGPITHKIYRDAKHQSCIRLPIVPIKK